MTNEYNIAKEFYKKKEYKKAYKVFLKLAKNGDIDSQVAVGNMLYNGQGIPLNIDMAYNWFKISANNNNPEAQYYCAMHYLEDLDEIDMGKEYLIKSYEQNYAPAITAIAYYYEYGDHKYNKDENKAIDLYKEACILENRDACKKLFVLMKQKKRIIELQKFIKDKLGYFKYLKIIIRL